MTSTTPAVPPSPGATTPGGTLIPLPSTGTGGVAGGTGGTGSGGTTAPGHVGNASQTTFTIPHGIHFPIFDGNDWAHWSGTMEAILILYEADNVIRHSTCPARVDKDDWAGVHRRAKAYLRLYIKPDVYSHVASEVDYPSFKEKWDVLSILYGSAVGSTTIFNVWTNLITG